MLFLVLDQQSRIMPLSKNYPNKTKSLKHTVYNETIKLFSSHLWPPLKLVIIFGKLVSVAKNLLEPKIKLSFKLSWTKSLLHYIFSNFLIHAVSSNYTWWEIQIGIWSEMLRVSARAKMNKTTSRCFLRVVISCRQFHQH